MQRFCPLLLAFVALVQMAYSQSVEKGFIEISVPNKPTNEAQYLDGTWEFYWDQLLAPGSKEFENPKEWIKVPNVWESVDNRSSLGCGTYRVTMAFDKPLTNYSIYIPVINSATKVFLNGQLVEEEGVVSKDQSVYEPRLSGSVVALPDDTTRIELIIQVANYTYFNGGMTRTPFLNQSSELYRKVEAGNGIENFFAGSLIAMFIYQLILFTLYRRGKSYLWLALICLTVALRALVTHGGSFLLPNLFESVNWELWKKMEFFNVYANVALFPLYIYDLFRDSSPRWPLRIFIGLATILCLVVVFTPQYTYGKLLDVCHIGLILAFVYAVYSVSRAWRLGNKDARIILLGVCSSFPFILLEIIRNSLLLSLNIQFAYLVELGVLVFLLFQIYLLAHHYSKSYKRLETINQDLEEIVASRTDELARTNSVKDRLLSVMSHDIKSPLNSLKGILQVYNMGGITVEEFAKFARQIEGNLNSTSMLVDNILYWTASQLKGVKINKTDFDLLELIDENLGLFQSICDNKNITTQCNLTTPMMINYDRNILNLVLRNLISNAVKFSHEGGTISISVVEENSDIKIQVADNGVGMSEEARNSIFNPQTSVSTVGTTNEKGTGIGLSLCREYLEKADGFLIVDSEPGKGTTFTISLPKA